MALWIALFAALLAAYWNHFGNSFHFDDSHAILENPAIRSLSGIPHFFTDARTFSHEPKGQSYRPLVTTSLAFDYWLGGGLDPFWFHLSTFFWFAIQIVLMYALYLYVLERTSPHPENAWIAWFAAAVYALHPVSAETVNYIVQRGDLYVALGIVAGLVVYAMKPSWRRYGVYLLPPLAAMFAKPPAVVFALFLLAFVLLIERASPLQAIPAFALGGAFLWLEKVMTPSTFFHTSIPTFDYWITQPYVTLRYVRSFFLPLYLNVNTDLPAFHALADPRVLAGTAFCALLLAAAVVTARKKEWRAISLGLWWFFIGLIPTAVYPLNEVENDHRMFLPFIGLSLAVTGTAGLLFRAGANTSRLRPAMAVAAVVLAAFAWGTHRRNEVWRTEETLWRDDIEKSPNNAPGHYNLGVALDKNPQRLEEAIAEWRTALRIDPTLFSAHYNLGVALAKIPGHSEEAISEYREVLHSTPDFATAHLNIAVILAETPERFPEAIAEYQEALRIAPDDAAAHYGLGVVLSKLPGRLPDAIAEYQAALRSQPNYAEAHNSLGLALVRLPDRLQDAIVEFKAATQLNPGSSEAHSNLGIALSRVPGRLPEAISEFEAAYRIRPDRALQLTLDNLRASRGN